MLECQLALTALLATVPSHGKGAARMEGAHGHMRQDFKDAQCQGDREAAACRLRQGFCVKHGAVAVRLLTSGSTQPSVQDRLLLRC